MLGKKVWPLLSLENVWICLALSLKLNQGKNEAFIRASNVSWECEHDSQMGLLWIVHKSSQPLRKEKKEPCFLFFIFYFVWRKWEKKGQGNFLSPSCYIGNIFLFPFLLGEFLIVMEDFDMLSRVCESFLC